MVLLKAEHITKKYSGRTIIKDINIELHKGELISLRSQRFWKDNSFPCPFWTDNSRGGKGIA